MMTIKMMIKQMIKINLLKIIKTKKIQIKKNE